MRRGEQDPDEMRAPPPPLHTAYRPHTHTPPHPTYTPLHTHECHTYIPQHIPYTPHTSTTHTHAYHINGIHTHTTLHPTYTLTTHTHTRMPHIHTRMPHIHTATQNTTHKHHTHTHDTHTPHHTHAHHTHAMQYTHTSTTHMNTIPPPTYPYTHHTHAHHTHTLPPTPHIQQHAYHTYPTHSRHTPHIPQSVCTHDVYTTHTYTAQPSHHISPTHIYAPHIPYTHTKHTTRTLHHKLCMCICAMRAVGLLAHSPEAVSTGIHTAGFPGELKGSNWGKVGREFSRRVVHQGEDSRFHEEPTERGSSCLW